MFIAIECCHYDNDEEEYKMEEIIINREAIVNIKSTTISPTNRMWPVVKTTDLVKIETRSDAFYTKLTLTDLKRLLINNVLTIGGN